MTWLTPGRWRNSRGSISLGLQRALRAEGRSAPDAISDRVADGLGQSHAPAGHASLGGRGGCGRLSVGKRLQHRLSPRGRQPTESLRSRHNRLTACQPQGVAFKRNDAMLEVLQIGVIVLPGMGIQDNLADRPGCSASLFFASRSLTISHSLGSKCPKNCCWTSLAKSQIYYLCDRFDRFCKTPISESSGARWFAHT